MHVCCTPLILGQEALRCGLYTAMDICEYERLRNDNVCRRTAELRQLLEVSTNSSSEVNNVILDQSLSSVSACGFDACTTPVQKRKTTFKLQRMTLWRCERNVSKTSAEEARVLQDVHGSGSENIIEPLKVKGMKQPC